MEDYKRYYITLTKMRTDGDIDIEQKVAYTEANARYQYNTYKAAAYTDTTYPQIAVSLEDYQLRQLEHCIVTTSYVDPNASTETAEDVESGI